jgi:hypothetical protein
MEQRQVARLLQRCPLLFSWPAEQRAGVLFGQLMALGLSAAQAALCFERAPSAAGSPSFEPATEVLADLFASCINKGTAGQQLLGALLCKQPTAVILLIYSAGALRERVDYRLVELGFSRQQLVEAVFHDAVLLRCPSNCLGAIWAVLERKLHMGPKLFARVAPLTARCSVATVERRAQVLVTVSEH